MQIKAYGLTDRGRNRECNEDSLLVDEERCLFAVADGLGGLPGGKEASQLTIKLLSQANLSKENSTDLEDALELISMDINQRLVVEGDSAYPFTGFGTTLTLGTIQHNKITYCHIGDSAMFVLTKGKLKKVTEDHTMERDFIAENGEAARAFMPRDYPHTLTRCLGQSEAIIADTGQFELSHGDRVLFCSDGLNKVINHHEIAQLLQHSDTPLEAASRLIEAANGQGGPDNITAIPIFIE